MKNRLLKSLVVYITFMVISVAIYGCCEQNYEIVGNGDFGAYSSYYNESNLIDTVKGEFNLYAHFEVLVTGVMKDNGFINSAWATSCEDNFLNMLLPEKTRLSINKPFEFQGQIIDSGTNIVNLEHIVFRTDTLWGYVEVNFTDDFLQNAKFDKADHEFKIMAETSDGLLLENKVTVFIDLD